ncbi:MAG TPA: MerR family transcriptional regulator [Candidatus Competibacter sp.]|nr:MerR family transcriptional regulator [Candidatus Competibacter sp.]
MTTPGLTIAAVERDTGLSKDVLRMWERRYGFPTPGRDANGNRLYCDEQVERLRMIKRLLDQGYRPRNVVNASTDDLKSLIARRSKPADQAVGDHDPVLIELLDLLQRHDSTHFQQALQRCLAKQGLQRFVKDTLAVLACRVGEAWERGALEIFQEHLFTEVTERILRQAIGAVHSSVRRPRIVLTTVPEEQHRLGLLMFEALLTLEEAECIALGAQMPLEDIDRAVRAHQADILTLSFSGAFSHRQQPALLPRLRALLPSETAIWAGGSGVLQLAKIEGVLLLKSFDEGLKALTDWTIRHS